MNNKNLVISFKNAMQGLSFAISTEKNLKIHLVAAFFAIAIGYYVQVTRIELVLIFCVVAIVIICELFNTAIEGLVDLVVQGYDERAKRIKDISAAAVFISAILAICVAYIVLIGIS